jgi:predicted Zn-dependent peptidase
MTIHTVTLPNGFRIICEKPNTKTPITSFQVFCDVGSIHEPDGLRGASHFIEHMCFKGTKTVPQSKDIFYVYDNVGAYFNASTNKRYTNYMVKCSDKYVKNCVDILSDMLLHSTFPPSEFRKEEDVVIEENIKDHDDPENRLGEKTDILIYDGTPFQYPIDTLAYHKKRFSYKKIVEFYKTHYQPSQMILSVVSNISFSTIVKMVKETYFAKPGDHPTLCNIIISPIHHTYRSIQYSLKEIPSLTSTHLSISFQTCNQLSKDRHILDFLKNVLSGALSSRLFRILREDNGLTYSSDINTFYCEVLGDFTIYTQMDSTKLIHNGRKLGVLPLIIQMLNDIIQRGITNEELIMFKHNLQGKLVLNQEDLDMQTEYNGTELLLYNDANNIIPFHKMYAVHYANLTCLQIHECVKRYFKKGGMVVCLMGGKLPSLRTVQRECEKLL